MDLAHNMVPQNVLDTQLMLNEGKKVLKSFLNGSLHIIIPLPFSSSFCLSGKKSCIKFRSLQTAYSLKDLVQNGAGIRFSIGSFNKKF